jgi:hypothetical protein
MGPEKIRDRALECMRLAQGIYALDHRSLLLEMAHRWADLANTADRFQMMAEAAEVKLKDHVKLRARQRGKPAGTPPRSSASKKSNAANQHLSRQHPRRPIRPRVLLRTGAQRPRRRRAAE